MKVLGNTFGLIFQIADDFEDYENDRKNEKEINYVVKNGKELAYSLYKDYVRDFKNDLKKTDLENPIFDELLAYLNNKTIHYYNII